MGSTSPVSESASERRLVLQLRKLVGAPSITQSARRGRSGFRDIAFVKALQILLQTLIHRLDELLQRKLQADRRTLQIVAAADF